MEATKDEARSDTGRRRWTRAPALVAAAILFIGVAGTWVGPDSSWDSRCPRAGQREGTSETVQASLWPPGSKCVVTLPSGSQGTRSYVPWREWLAVLLAAAISWAAARSAVRRLRTR